MSRQPGASHGPACPRRVAHVQSHRTGHGPDVRILSQTPSFLYTVISLGTFSRVLQVGDEVHQWAVHFTRLAVSGCPVFLQVDVAGIVAAQGGSRRSFHRPCRLAGTLVYVNWKWAGSGHIENTMLPVPDSFDLSVYCNSCSSVGRAAMAWSVYREVKSLRGRRIDCSLSRAFSNSSNVFFAARSMRRYQVPVVASFFMGSLSKLLEAGDVGYQNQGFFPPFTFSSPDGKLWPHSEELWPESVCGNAFPFRIIQMLVVYSVKIYGIGVIGSISFGWNLIAVGRSGMRQERVEWKSGLQPLCAFRLQAQYNHWVGAEAK